tara:strand:+ start:1422 stop:2042 length:621 start_codon:yes stop_codon:yes gene_type:complete
MSIVTYNNRSIRNISAIPGAAKSLTHIKTLTASSSSTLSFVNGSDDVVLDSTYPIYLFKFINIHNSAVAQFQVNFRDGSTAYDATKTTTTFYAYHAENAGEQAFSYVTSTDIASGTGSQALTTSPGIENDEAGSGEMYLFNPSSTTFVKHFFGRINYVDDSGSPLSVDFYPAGYCNVTAAIDAVQFSCSSGNIDSGTIKLYGIKDS